MVNYPRWAIITTIVIALLGLIYASPNFFPQPEEVVESSGVLPSKRMNLGLDLQGGSSLLLSVGVETAIRETLESVESTVRRELRQRGSRIGYSGLRVEGRAIAFTLRDAADSETARDRLRNLEDGFELEISDDVNFRLAMSEVAEAARRQSAVEQSIEIVRRRVDETGVAEPVIQQQGQDRILVQLPGIKDPERIKRLLGQTAKLAFHMLDESVSIQEAESGNLPAGSILLYSPEEEGRIPYVVRRTVEVAGDRLVDAQPTFQDNQPVVSFRFDTVGRSRSFADVTDGECRPARSPSCSTDEGRSARRCIRDRRFSAAAGIISGQFHGPGGATISRSLLQGRRLARRSGDRARRTDRRGEPRRRFAIAAGKDRKCPRPDGRGHRLHGCQPTGVFGLMAERSHCVVNIVADHRGPAFASCRQPSHCRALPGSC